MTIKTELLPAEKAAFIQQHCAEYNCTCVELGVSGSNSAKVTVLGPDEDIKRLFDKINE